MPRLQIRRVAGENGRRKHTRGRQAQGTPSPRLGATTASMAGSQGRSCWSTKCGHGCRYGWMGAGRMPCSWPTKRTGENFCHDLHSERSTKFARRTRATTGLGHDCINPKGYSAVVSRTASATHRFAHGFRGQAGQTPVQGKHEGFEAQAIRRSSHNRPHGCSVTCAVPFTQAAGTQVGERARCGLLLGLPGQGVRPCDLGAPDHGGGSKGAAAVGGFFVTGLGKNSTHMSVTIISGRSVAKQASQGYCWLVGALPAKAGGSSRQTSVLLSRSGAFGTVLPGCSGATKAAKLMLTLLETLSSRLPTHRLWNVVDDISGARGSVSQDGSGPHGRGSQALGGRPSGARPTALQGQIQSTHRWHGQAQAGPFGLVGGAWDRRVRHGTHRWGRSAAWQASTGTRRQGAFGEGSEAHETSQAASEGSGTHSQSDSYWLECWGALWFRASLLHSSKPPELTRPKPLIGSARGQNATPTMMAHAQAAGEKNIDPAFQHHRQVVLAWAAGVWEGTSDLDTMQAALRGTVARLSHLKRPWCGAHLRAHALAAGLERAVGEALHQPRWHEDRPLGGGSEDGWFLGGSGFPLVVRQLCTLESFQGTAILGSHQAATRFWQVGGVVSRASERAGPSWVREAFGPRSGSRGLGKRTTTAVSSATKAQTPSSTVATSARPCRQSETCRRVLWGHNTSNSLHTAFSPAPLPFCRQVLSSGHTLFCGTVGSWRGTFSRTSLRRAVARCGEQAGQWWR